MELLYSLVVSILAILTASTVYCLKATNDSYNTSRTKRDLKHETYTSVLILPT